MTPRNQRERLEAVWREKLDTAAEAYRVAFAMTRELQADLEVMPAADGNVLLEKAFKAQAEALGEYTRLLDTFTRLVVNGIEPPSENT